ncbi:MAG: cytidine deaminase [Bacteroidales bacterium]|nr:cytidine deaminase [Bacteroidales bacterium]
MDIKQISVRVEEFTSLKELNNSDRELLEQATQASETSYSPYSAFRVGSAVRLTNGIVISGNNQENAAYPSGICAERVALFYAQAQFPDVSVDAIAIFARSNEFKLDKPVTPCGACRQVMAEYENRHGRKMRVIMGNEDGQIQILEGMENLLPLMFMLEKLKKR